MDENTLERPVEDIMNSPVRTVDYDTSVADAARTLTREDIGSLVVGDDPIGIVAESDIVDAVGAERDVDRMTVGQVMTEGVTTVDAADSVETACERMRDEDIKKLPVTGDDGLAGIITTTDVTHALVPELDDVITAFQ